MADHGARDHATWAASSTARNWHCPGALAISAIAPAQKESIHAARGTACHQVAEKCLRQIKEPSEFLGQIEKTKEHEIEVDEEIVNSAQEYYEYVMCRFNAGSDLWIEERFSLNALSTPFDAGGTGDAVIYDLGAKQLEVVDLKHGMGVVDAKENPQLRTYALGAMLHHQDLDVDTVKVTIVQPRAPHKDGRIRSETFHVADLVEWTADLLAAMNRAKAAKDEFGDVGGNAVKLDDWAEKWLNPGKCKFCPAEGFCPALKKKALEVAAVWFDDMDQPKIGNSALDTDPAAIARDLDMTEMLEGWIAARWALAKQLAENGTEIPGYQLSEKIGNRAWAIEDQAKLLSDLKTVAGLTDDDIYAEPKVKTPAQLEKVLRTKERKALIANMWHRPITGRNLVSKAKTSRPAIAGRAEQYFEQPAGE